MTIQHYMKQVVKTFFKLCYFGTLGKKINLLTWSIQYMALIYLADTEIQQTHNII